MIRLPNGTRIGYVIFRPHGIYRITQRHEVKVGARSAWSPAAPTPRHDHIATYLYRDGKAPALVAPSHTY